MPRKSTSKPAHSHLATLARMIEQVDADGKMTPRKKGSIKKKIADLMGEFSKEVK